MSQRSPSFDGFVGLSHSHSFCSGSSALRGVRAAGSGSKTSSAAPRAGTSQVYAPPLLAPGSPHALRTPTREALPTIPASPKLTVALCGVGERFSTAATAAPPSSGPTHVSTLPSGARSRQKPAPGRVWTKPTPSSSITGPAGENVAPAEVAAALRFPTQFPPRFDCSQRVCGSGPEEPGS